MLEEDGDLNKEITLLTRNFKRFLKEKVGVTSSRRQEEGDKVKVNKRDLKFEEKKENTKDKI